jgi:NhaA family Na+:H+ antiporter
MLINKKEFYISRFINKFLELESKSGILMILAACFALIIANSNFNVIYHDFLHLKIEFTIGKFILSNTIHAWVNEFLMAFFFMIVGLEIKQELIEGSLSTRSQVILPLIGAIFGMIFPAMIYYAFTYNNPQLIKGWAIPIVTDIAFALCVLSFFKQNIPSYLRVFLLSLAIFDDLIGIIIIAIFYTKSISLYFLIAAICITLLAIICNLKNITSLTIYMILSLILWYFLLKSGIHATLSGVIIALCVPLKNNLKQRNSPLKQLMHILHPWVSNIIVPLFAFVNSGINLSYFGVKDLLNPLSLGIILGLFIGKQFGVFISLFIAIKSKLFLPTFKLNWLQLYGVSILTGIGFTVSLFISELSFVTDIKELSKLGILVASLLSAIFGFIILKLSVSKAYID